jgi:hypothetical protein
MTVSMKTSFSSNSSPLVALKEFDWRRLQRLTDPQSMKDLDQFLDNLPVRAGKNALIIAVVMWVLAACGIFLLFHNTLSLREIQKQLSIAEGTRITVPQMAYNPVSPALLRPLVDKLKKIYPSLTIDNQNGNIVTIKGMTTRDFPLWRAALGDLAYGGPGWKLNVQKFCTGHGCKEAPLVASVMVQDVNIQLTAAPVADTTVKTTTP